MNKKTSLVVIALVLFIQSFYGALLSHASTGQQISENILTGVTLTVKDANGNTVTDPVYEQGASVTLDYTWELPNGHGYKSGAVYTFWLPVQFKLYNDISAELKKDDGSSVGTFQVEASSRQVTMVFNEKVENDDVHGTLTFHTQFDKQTIQGSTEQQIYFPIRNGYTITLHFKPSVKSSVEKSGIPQGYNADRIHWTVDVNKTLETVKNATVADRLPAGLTMATPVTAAVYRLQVNLDGSVLRGDPLSGDQYEAALNAGELTVKFKNETISGAYRIEFSTEIVDSSLSTFTNEAVFKGDNVPEIRSSATVNVQRGSHLKKAVTGYDAKTQTITWAILYNYDEKRIPQADASLTDQFDALHELVPGSLAVYPMALDSSGKETAGSPLTAGVDYNWLPAAGAGKKGFTLSFTRDVTSAYKIVYKTKATDRVYENGKITNTVTSATYSDTNSQNVIQMIVNKSRGAVDYQNKTVSWTIRLNEDQYPMNNIVLTDTFTNGGLTLVPGSLSITSQSVASSVYDVVYRASNPSAVTDGFVIKLNNNSVTSATYAVTYKTYFNVDWLAAGKTSFLNTAKMDWDGGSKEVTASFDPNNETKNNGFKFGSYNAASKQLLWAVGINYNGKELANARIVDNLLKGQTLVPGSVKVYNMIVAPDGGGSKGAEVAASGYSVSQNGTELIVQFNNKIQAPYWLEFATSLEGQVIENIVTNTANVFDGVSPVSKDLKGSVTIPHGGEYVFKDGKQTGDRIDWSIAVNRGQSFVQDAKLTDTPSGNQVLIPESFHLYPTAVTSGGDVSKSGPELTKDVDYRLQIQTDDTGSQTFVLSFLKEIRSAYILEYQSLIVANNGDHVSNTVRFSGTNVQTVIVPTTKDIIVGVSSGSGTGSGTRGTLTVKKMDEANASVKLEGAVFSLYRQAGPDRIWINTLTTSSAGTAEFKNLLSGSYVLKEVTAPAGYVLDSKEYPVTINSTAGVALNVTNKKSGGGNPGGNPGTDNPGTDTPGTDTPDSETPDTDSPGSGTPGSGPSTPGESTPGTPGQSPAAPGTPTPNNPGSVTPNPDTPAIEIPTPGTPSGEKPEAGQPPDEVVITPQDSPSSDGATPSGSAPDNVPTGERLPKTGEDSPLAMQIAGICLILLGVVWRKKFLSIK
ncbi:collagen binding domain-containing protein [Paenibacillus allorhizosphaerae]|uniref:LPXTG cell wall anchor domain-containing protein n=1 Tax=Paenibacillus allorhizosphaerae TaxID=2849866 RepID=A0ABM8VLF5_9BACL|nr:collagen binding domain-containing protein [Paenibacillus allorhizosphaerae]CAG7648553.1 hypothetical protein PAECIP111802_04245 [Paenibacillus allorhizosphaerae]